MITWLSQVKRINRGKPINLRPFKIEQIELEPADNLNEIAMLFIAGSVLISEGMMVSLPTKNESSRKQILEEVAPHFQEIKLVWVDHQIEKINMRFVKEQSKKLFKNGNAEFLEVVKDLYRTTENGNWTNSSKRSIQRYRIVQEKIQALHMSNTEGIKEYILREFIEEDEELVLIPTGWYLQDELRESLFLRFVASFVPVIDLLVDQDNNEIIAIELMK